ncbi:hypothetical protein [uncultured Roseibium sp.]|uniref:hypothetical protein n=1 Tax=uncultured Roseibium sp. TaxID=1936171 RepID=UPI003217B2B2
MPLRQDGRSDRFLGGALQGATGISAPASITFLNALKLPRSTFIATISVFFIVMSIGQIEQLVVVGLLDWHRFFLGLGVTVAIALFMPVATIWPGIWRRKPSTRSCWGC